MSTAWSDRQIDHWQRWSTLRSRQRRYQARLEQAKQRGRHLLMGGVVLVLLAPSLGGIVWRWWT